MVDKKGVGVVVITRRKWALWRLPVGLELPIFF